MDKQVSVFLAVVLSFLASTCTLNTAQLASSANSSQIDLAKGHIVDAIHLLHKQNLSGAALTDLKIANMTLAKLSPKNPPAPPLPTADSKAVSTNTSTPVNITLTGHDPLPLPDVLKFSVVGIPKNGTLTNPTSTHTVTYVTYTPNATFSGTDSFTYKATTKNGQGVDSKTATVTTVTIAPPCQICRLLKPLQAVLAVLLAAPVAVSGNNMYVVWPNNDTGHWNVFFAKSTDGGKSIQNTIILSAPNKGHTIDQNTGITASGTNVFVTWWTNKTGVLKPVLRTSSDSGVTFGKTITLNSTNLFAKTLKSPL